MSIRITVKGLDDFADYVKRIPEAATTAARIAVNDTLGLARRLGAKGVQEQVSLTTTYLEENLQVTRKASDHRLEGEVTGRDRPVSLARFARGQVNFGRQRRQSVQVQVSPRGGVREVRQGFFLKLRRGKELGDGNFNIGLAIRLKPGETIRNKREMVRFANNIYLLYGPSVGQVFDDVAVEIEPQLADNLENEFVRQFERIK